MANMAPQTAYQGSKDMKRKKAPSRPKKTVASKGKYRPRVTQTPFGGDDLGGM